MDQGEFEHWQAVTSSSRYLWVEDAVSRLNGLQVGNYEGAIPPYRGGAV